MHYTIAAGPQLHPENIARFQDGVPIVIVNHETQQIWLNHTPLHRDVRHDAVTEIHQYHQVSKYRYTDFSSPDGTQSTCTERIRIRPPTYTYFPLRGITMSLSQVDSNCVIQPACKSVVVWSVIPFEVYEK